MHYDPIKRSLGNVFNKSPFLRKSFYNLLDLLLLRAWHVHKELKTWKRTLQNKKEINVLDAGAGFGQYTYWMNRRDASWKILSLDVKEEQVADCNNFFKKIGAKNVLFEVGDLIVEFLPTAAENVGAGDYNINLLSSGLEGTANFCYAL